MIAQMARAVFGLVGVSSAARLSIFDMFKTHEVGASVESLWPDKPRVGKDRGWKIIQNETFWTGYINIDTKYQDVHYTLFESRRTNQADKDPLLIWLRGEPGCSVSQSIIDNMSPFTYDRNATSHDPAKIISNKLSWNEFSNMLFVDFPVGTGYSFYKVDDKNRDFSIDQVVTDFVHFIKIFYLYHPSYKGREIYIAA